jgi:CheY-like chemotaxis protein
VNSVLIVEDYPSLQKIYSEVLKKEHLSVETAADGVEALKILAKRDFDLILLDMLMPNMDGLEFLRQFKEVKKPDLKTKIIAFSNIFTLDMAKAAKDLGASRYYAKAGFSPKDMILMINELI